MHDRKDYWNEKYLEYWKTRVQENDTESKKVRDDTAVPDTGNLEKLFLQNSPQPGSVLEVGCGWGRLFSIYKKFDLKITGIDISNAMISKAQDTFSGDSAVEELIESPGEYTPFQDESFNNVCCLATFDAMYQDLALKEMLRILKTGGLLFLTGKNSRYHPNDQQALNAEIGARHKGHPNYFTNVNEMIEQLVFAGNNVKAINYFKSRGDFALEKFTTVQPKYFYEWFLVLQKQGVKGEFHNIYNEYSHTFLELNKSNL